MNKSMWEILVPTIHGDSKNPVKVKHHRVWDAFVRNLSGGLTIGVPNIGQWISPVDELITERMIPVRILCTEIAIKEIAKFTLAHYHQQAVLFYKITDNCEIMYANGKEL